MTTTTAMIIENLRHSLPTGSEWHLSEIKVVAARKESLEDIAKNLLVLFMDIAPTSSAPARVLTFTMFTIEVRGKMFAITAGHVLKEIQEALSSGLVTKSVLVDSLHLKRTIGEADKIPVDIKQCISNALYHDDEGVDVAAFELSDYYAGLIRASGHVPATGSQTQYPSGKKFHSEFLIGLPGQPQKTQAIGKKLQHSGAVVVLELDEVGIAQTVQKKACPRIERVVKPKDVQFDDGSRLEKIEGMSGGPVIAVRYDDEGAVEEVCVLGIQSSWDPDQKIIYATYLHPLVRLIEAQLDKVINC